MRALPVATATALLLAVLLTPSLARTAPSTFIEAGSGQCRDVAFTYDTEFGEVTPHLAQTLEELNVRATFFFVGDDIAANADLVRRLAARHQVASHTYSHPFMADLTEDEMRQEFALSEEAIASVTGRTPRPYWRPPFGNYDETVLEIAGEMGYDYTIYWSMDSVDWQGPSAELIHERLVSQAFPGGIALMHGSPLNTPEGTRRAVADLREKGYQFVTVSEILGHDRHRRDFGGDTYTVQPGDDMAWVAGCHNLTEERLEAYNETDDPAAGTTLTIPHTREVIIRVDGERQEFPVWPRVRDGRAIAHIRLAERLGAEVTWDGARAIVRRGETELIVIPGDRTALANGEPVDMGTAALKEHDRILVPVRFVAEHLGYAVAWDGATWTVTISQ